MDSSLLKKEQKLVSKEVSRPSPDSSSVCKRSGSIAEAIDHKNAFETRSHATVSNWEVHEAVVMRRNFLWCRRLDRLRKKWLEKSDFGYKLGHIRLILFIGTCLSSIITMIIFTRIFYYFNNDSRCNLQLQNRLSSEKLSIMHSNIFTSSASFSKLKRVGNCSLHSNHSKLSMPLLLRRFNEIFQSSCILTPPLLVSTLDFYIGSYSVSLIRQRLHLTFINCYPERECHGSYESVLSQQGFSHDSIQEVSQNKSNVVRLLSEHVYHRFACVFDWNNGQRVSELHIVSNKMSGSAYCALPKQSLAILDGSTWSLKVLIVSRLHNEVLILSKIDCNLFDLNVPISRRNVSRKPFKLTLACAPLTWSQIRTNVLLEWIIYHRLVGVDHFLVYIKEESLVNIESIIQYLAPFISDHTITLIKWQFGAFLEPENAFQIPQMIDAVQRTADYSVWTMIGDTDEFFYAKHYDTLTAILASYQTIAEQNLSVSYRQELTIPNVHMMRGSTELNREFITGKFFRRHETTAHPQRSKIIAYSGGDRFLMAEEVHFFSKDSTFVPEQLLRLNHYFNAYNASRTPIEKLTFVRDDTSLWQRYGAPIQDIFGGYLQRRRAMQILNALDCNHIRCC